MSSTHILAAAGAAFLAFSVWLVLRDYALGAGLSAVASFIFLIAAAVEAAS